MYVWPNIDFWLLATANKTLNWGEGTQEPIRCHLFYLGQPGILPSSSIQWMTYTRDGRMRSHWSNCRSKLIPVIKLVLLLLANKISSELEWKLSNKFSLKDYILCLLSILCTHWSIAVEEKAKPTRKSSGNNKEGDSWIYRRQALNMVHKYPRMNY